MNTTKVNLVSLLFLFISSPAAGKDSFGIGSPGINCLLVRLFH